MIWHDYQLVLFQPHAMYAPAPRTTAIQPQVIRYHAIIQIVMNRCEQITGKNFISNVRYVAAGPGIKVWEVRPGTTVTTVINSK